MATVVRRLAQGYSLDPEHPDLPLWRDASSSLIGLGSVLFAIGLGLGVLVLLLLDRDDWTSLLGIWFLAAPGWVVTIAGSVVGFDSRWIGARRSRLRITARVMDHWVVFAVVVGLTWCAVGVPIAQVIWSSS